MHLPWRKRNPTPRVLTIPPEHVREYFRLQDALSAAPMGCGRSARYELWTFIASIHPDALREGA